VTETVGTYARLSRLKGRDESISTQQRLCREHAKRLYPGCEVVEYVDPDASGEREDVVRPDYDRLKADLLSGRLTQVVTSDQPRLTRRPDELEHLITVFRVAGVPGFNGYRDGWTSVGLGASAGARYKGVAAKEYVEGIKVNVLERLKANGDRGQPAGGRFYGYQRVTVNGVKTLRFAADEVATVERILADVRAGKSLRSIATWLFEEDVRAPKGGRRWAITSIRNLVTSPHLAGLLTRQGEVFGPGNWEGLITPEERDDLRALFGSRTLKSPRHHARKYVLSGLLWCPDCEDKMGGGGGTHQEYHCRWCGRSVAAEKTERYIVGELLPRIDELNRLLSLTDEHEDRRDELLAGLRRIEQQRRTYGRWLADEEMDDATYQTARQRLAEQERDLRTELSSLPAPVTKLTTSRAARQGFAGLAMAEQRALVEQYVERVEVRATKARRWSPDRLTVLTRVPVESEAARVLLAGRRSYVERTGGPAPDLAAASRFVELADITPTPEDEAAYLDEKFTETQLVIDEELDAERAGSA